MGKVNLMMLAFNGFILLSLICATMLGLTGYAVAEQWPGPNLSPAGIAPAPIATAVPSPTPEPEVASKAKESRIEYYRGIFDICVFSGRNSTSPEKVIVACREVVQRAVEQNWFELPSKEWSWPLPVAPSRFSQNG